MLNTALEAPVRVHLKKVYTCMSISTLAAGFGAYVHVFTDILQGNLITFFISLGLMFALHSIPHESKNQNLRLGLLMGVAFSVGLGLGPLLDFAIVVDPSIVTTAFLVSCVIFVCFTLSSLLSRDKMYLYIGGPLMSLLSVTLLLQIASIFFPSVALFKMQLYLGLVLFCGFVLYDTQKIIEMRRRGDTDYILHSINLFLDFVNIFRHVLVLLLQSQSQSQDTRRKKKERN